MWSKLNINGLQDQFNQLNIGSKVGVGLLGLYASYLGTQKIFGFYKCISNGKIRRRKQQENVQSIKDLAERLKRDPISVDKVAYITKLTLTDLVQELKEGKIRPIEALKAYQTKALDAHTKTNCLVEAITEAEDVALQLEKGPREGALWGVPISIKDDVGIKGYDSCIGQVIKVGQPNPDDAEMLKVLRRQGAIPFVKTNVPQTELSFEPGNPINGMVHNPYKRGYGPGGSSSGEAALIGSGGSPLGIGSDLGGSIRVPAHFCGVFGYKPTSERMSTRGMSLDDMSSAIPIRGVWGPLAKDMDGVVTLMKTLWTTDHMAKADPECIPMPFNTEEFNSDRKLRIGYYTNNGMVPTFSACARATEMAKTILTNLGHEVVAWEPPEPIESGILGTGILTSDGGKFLRSELQYDINHPTISEFTSNIYTPRWYRKMMSFLVHPFNPEWSIRLHQSCGKDDVAANAITNYALWTKRRVIQDSWNEAGLDAVICPPQAMVAPPHGNAKLLMDTMLFTFIYNITHYPAGVVPMTFVHQNDVDQVPSDFPKGKAIHEHMRKAMSDTVGLPVGVMVVSARYRDETCLRVMQMIADHVKK